MAPSFGVAVGCACIEIVVGLVGIVTGGASSATATPPSRVTCCIYYSCDCNYSAVFACDLFEAIVTVGVVGVADAREIVIGALVHGVSITPSVVVVVEAWVVGDDDVGVISLRPFHHPSR